MQASTDRRFHELFFAGLALASASCSTYQSAPRETGPAAHVPTAGDPITDPAAVELAKQYRAADLAKALPGADLLAFVENAGLVGSVTTCSPAPCDPAWVKLAENSGRRVAIFRRNGVHEKVSVFNFKEILGAIDTPDKAALVLSIDGHQAPATCERLVAQALACADGSPAGGIPVRQVETGFEVVTYGPREVCDGNQSGSAIALDVWSVAPTGELSRVDNALAKAAAAGVLPQVECRYPSRGRMFEGFVAEPREACELSYYLRAAREESAAVVAFERLAMELAQHEAPRELIAAAERSARQERRHAALFRREAARLAAALGVEVLAPAAGAPAAFQQRSLAAMLDENAVEGCANETYAAVVATYQAEHAPSPRLCAVFTSIASDEREHAALAHHIHLWGLTVLDVAGAQAVADKHRAACERMADASRALLGDRMGEPPLALAAAAFRHIVAELTRAA